MPASSKSMSVRSSRTKDIVNDIDTIEVIPSDGALGAEVRSLDLSAPLSARAITAVRQALLDHCVVFFRAQAISENDQVRFTNYFGTAERHVRDQPDRQVPEILIVSNLLEDGQPIGALGDGEIGFHSDLSYMPMPGTLSTLYAIEISDSGGATQWCNGYAAYDALDDGLKTRIADIRAVHRHPREVQNPAEPIDHPIVCTHPETGRKTLYVSPYMTRRIVGLENDEGGELLAALLDHATSPAFVWTHDWQAGDLVMWDNRPTMHRREAFPPDQRRLMKRTQVFNDVAPVA
jgi:taurine dioxygenase